MTEEQQTPDPAEPVAPQGESANTEQIPPEGELPEVPVVTGAEAGLPPMPELAMSIVIGRACTGELVVSANGFNSGYEVIGFIVNECDPTRLTQIIQKQMTSANRSGPMPVPTTPRT